MTPPVVLTKIELPAAAIAEHFRNDRTAVARFRRMVRQFNWMMLSDELLKIRRLCAEPVNRCATCGQFVGEQWTGYTHDRMSARGPLFCEQCVQRQEIQR